MAKISSDPFECDSVNDGFDNAAGGVYRQPIFAPNWDKQMTTAGFRRLLVDLDMLKSAINAQNLASAMKALEAIKIDTASMERILNNKF
jgi:hypothetical protein